MTTYALAGTVAAGESVTVIENSASGFLHIEYSSSNKTKRGYIQSSKLEDKKRGKLARVNGNLNEYHVYNGPDLSEDNTSVYVTNESVYNGEYVIVLDQIEQGQYNRAWYYIDFNTKDGRKRGYIPQDSITDIRGNGAIVSERKGHILLEATVKRLKSICTLVQAIHMRKVGLFLRANWSVFLPAEHMNLTTLKLSIALKRAT